MAEFEPQTILLVGAVLVGVLFGGLARMSAFCLRSAVLEMLDGAPGRQSLAWMAALLTAIVGTQSLAISGLLDLSETPYLSASVAFPVIALGGLLFGIGMVMTRGCGGRHLVLAAGGNMRSWIVLLVFGFSGYATMRGLIALPRTWLEGSTGTELAAGSQSLPGLISDWYGFAGDDASLFVTIGIAVALSGLSLSVAIRRPRPSLRFLATGAAIGLLIPLAWAVSGIIGYDEFDPAAPVGLTFTAPIGNSIQYLMTFTGATADFGIAAVGGTLAGSFLIALLKRDIHWQGYETVPQLSRYLIGAALMGIGGVAAVGCSIGAGLTGVSTLSSGSILALLAIIGGAVLARKIEMIQATQPVCMAPAE